MANYLVTGGGGFIGSHIVEHLVRMGDSVRVLDNFSTGSERNLIGFQDRIELLRGDLRNPTDAARAVEDIEYVLHHAAVPSVPRSLADPVRSHESNITGTLNLLIAARDAGVHRFVFASSSSVYGDQPVTPKSEDLRPNPLSPYAVSKLAGESYVAAFSKCFGLKSVSLRYFNVFGPRQDPNSPYSAVIPLFISAVLDGRQPTIHGDGSQARDFTFVENAVQANIAAARATIDAAGQVYNIACGTSISVRELLREINEIARADVQAIHSPPRPGDIAESRADIRRAREELGYTPSVAFRDGLKRTFDWYRSARTFQNVGSS